MRNYISIVLSGAVLAVAAALVVGALFGYYLIQPHHTVTRTPTPCQHAAAAAWTHLHALSDESGTRVPVEAIHQDMAGLRSCR